METRRIPGQSSKSGVEAGHPVCKSARQTNRIHCFLARGLTTAGGQSLDDSEEISSEFALQADVVCRILQRDFFQASMWLPFSWRSNL
jgi:hypothetical protein